MTLLAIAVGLALLVVGGDILVRGAVRLAAQSGISPLLVGLTVVAFGTSTPELVTSLDAALSGAPGIAIGNVVGSNIANILLILGAAALVAPVAVSAHALRRDGSVLLLATLAAVGLALYGEVPRGAGLLLIAGLLGHIVFAYRRERRPADRDGTDPDRSGRDRVFPILMTVLGIAVTIAGARLLVSGAVALATAWGVSETLVGLTIVAIGTSLPELVTSLVAAIRRESDIAFGNILGSNIFNILAILGLTAIVTPIAVPQEIVRVDVWVMLAATVALLLIAYMRGSVSRIAGGLLLAAYAAYLAWLGFAA